MAEDFARLDEFPDLSPSLPDWLADAALPSSDLPDWLRGGLPELLEPPTLEMPPDFGTPPDELAGLSRRDKPNGSLDEVCSENPTPLLLGVEAAEEWMPSPILPRHEPELPKTPALPIESPAVSPQAVPVEVAGLTPQGSSPTDVPHFSRLIDDRTQEVISAQRITTRLHVAIRSPKHGKSTVYGVQVRNSRPKAMHEVTVEHSLPLGLRFLAADPPPRHRGRRLIWNLNSLGAGAGQTLRVKVVPTSLTDSAEVTRAGFDVSSIQETGLLLTIVGPTRMRLGERSALRLRVLNTREDPVAETLVQCRISSTTPGAKCQLLETRLSSLAPGETRTIRLETQVRRPGSIQCVATAIATGIRPATVRMVIKVDFGAAMSGSALNRASALAAGDWPESQLPAVPEEPRDQHMLFSLAGNDFAIPANQVVEVDRPPEVTPVPHVPDWLLGVANIRGDVIAVIDGREFSGLPAAEQPQRRQMIVVRSADGDVTTGLVVDRVLGLRPLSRHSVEGGARSESGLARFIKRNADWDGASLPVLDLDGLLASSELRQFETLS